MRALHTIVWVFFVGAILAIPVFAWQRRFMLALLFAGVVLVEVAILAANRMRCPLTDVAARYTDDRRDNFDIYLPLLVARYNKQIFGPVYVAALLFVLLRWLATTGPVPPGAP